MKKWPGIFSLAGATLFLILFYEQDAGINQSVFAVFCTAIIWYFTKDEKRGWFLTGCIVSTILLAIAVAWHGEGYSRILLGVNLWILAGAAVTPQIVWPGITLQHSTTDLVNSQIAFFTEGIAGKFKKRKTSFIRTFAIYLIPVGLIVLFVVFFRASNPVFDKYAGKILEKLARITDYLNFLAILTFIVGLFITNIFVFRVRAESLVEYWEKAARKIIRKSKKPSGERRSGLGQGLRNEYKSALFLFVSMNILLFLLNISDVKVVWLDFEWSNQNLTTFVHEGTWYLIISILISVGILVFYFRANLNFYGKKGTLRWLAYLWILQNAFLAVSVGMRNYNYIEYYGLAYKRIGVFFFLLAIFIGLIFLYYKIKKNDSTIVWLNRNLALALAVLSLAGWFDWSTIITRYNLAHYKQSFVHLEFLANMPDRTLSIMHEYKDKLGEIKKVQLAKGFDYKDTIENVSFADLLEQRCARFKEYQVNKAWQEWCYADARALRELK